MVGTHTATFPDGTLLVMFHGKEVSGKLIEWTLTTQYFQQCFKPSFCTVIICSGKTV